MQETKSQNILSFQDGGICLEQEIDKIRQDAIRYGSSMNFE